MKEKWIKKLKEDKKLIIKGLGTFYLLPRRKGKINGTFGTTPKYTQRVKFKPSVYLREQTCK